MPSTEDAEQAFPGDGEMARRMRAHDWATTPFGEPSQWPSSLQTACRICLTSSLPMLVWWGEDLYFLYNDTYRPFLGTGAAGRPRPAGAGSRFPGDGRLGPVRWLRGRRGPRAVPPSRHERNAAGRPRQVRSRRTVIRATISNGPLRRRRSALPPAQPA